MNHLTATDETDTLFNGSDMMKYSPKKKLFNNALNSS